MSGKMPQQTTRFLPRLLLAGWLSAPLAMAADESVETFLVQKGHLSTNARELARSHGWSLVWDSGEDRIIKRSFSVPNPSLEKGLSDVLAGYEDVFAVNLDQAERVVYVTAAARTYVEDAPDSAGNGRRFPESSEPDPKPTSLPEPPPFEERKRTVRMLDLSKEWKSQGGTPAMLGRTTAADLKSPSVNPPAGRASPGDEKPALSETPESTQSKASPSEERRAASRATRPGAVLQILSLKDRKKVENELSRLRAHGHDAFLEEFRQGDMLWYRLKMRLASGQSVKTAKLKLKDLGYDAVWVVSRGFSEESPSVGQ